MVIEADERGYNKYLQWRSMKKDFLIEKQKDGNDWEQLRTLLLYTWKHKDQIQEDKKVIDSRDLYRENNGKFVVKFE